jgi:hypothetical protein
LRLFAHVPALYSALRDGIALSKAPNWKILASELQPIREISVDLPPVAWAPASDFRHSLALGEDFTRRHHDEFGLSNGTGNDSLRPNADGI